MVVVCKSDSTVFIYYCRCMCIIYYIVITIDDDHKDKVTIFLLKDDKIIVRL